MNLNIVSLITKGNTTKHITNFCPIVVANFCVISPNLYKNFN